MDKTRHLDPFEPGDAAAETFGGISPAVYKLDATQADELETERLPEHCLTYGHHPKIRTINAMKRKKAIIELGRLPGPGESIHVISNARFDFWDWVPAVLSFAEPRRCVEWIGSTWILNRRNAVELLALYDAGKIQKIGMITGIYFKRRSTDVFATIYEGLSSRGQRFKAGLNHSKWFTMRFDDGTGITVEASANFTENGNMENFVYTNDRGLHDFYKGVADEILDARE